jgi:hypothetical protein
MEDEFAKFRLSNETRALFRCSWCGHKFEAPATEFSNCPKCNSGGHCRHKCEVCDKVFTDGQSAAGGRPAKVCSPRCRVRKHRVTKRGLKTVTPNDRVEGRDAALSRRVPSHDGLCGNGNYNERNDK